MAAGSRAVALPVDFLDTGAGAVSGRTCLRVADFPDE